MHWRHLLVKFLLIKLLLLVVVVANAAEKDVTLSIGDAMEDGRDKRAIDFGIILRNLLLKSAQLSNVKANITRNIANAKTTRRPATTTTTTTAAPAPPPPPRRRPIYKPWPVPVPGYDYNGGIGNYYHPSARALGYLPFDYDDYYDNDGAPPAMMATTTAPTTTTTTTMASTTTMATPQPTRARRPRPRPRPIAPQAPPVYYPIPQQQLIRSKPNFYDYDYAEAVPQPAAPTQRKRLPGVAAGVAVQQRRLPLPLPLPGNQQLSDNLLYQYAQPDDIYSKASPVESVESAERSDDGEPNPNDDNNNNNNNNDNDDEDDDDANADADDNEDGADTNLEIPPPANNQAVYTADAPNDNATPTATERTRFIISYVDANTGAAIQAPQSQSQSLPQSAPAYALNGAQQNGGAFGDFQAYNYGDKSGGIDNVNAPYNTAAANAYYNQQYY